MVALGELLQAGQVTIVVADQDQAALTPARQQAPPRIEGRQQHVAELRGGRHQPVEILDAHPQQRAAGHRDAGEEGRLPHQHPELADEVTGLDHEADAVVPPVHEMDAAFEDEVEVVGVAPVPQQLAGFRPDHVAGRLQQRQALLVELRPRLELDLVHPLRRVAGPLVGHRRSVLTSGQAESVRGSSRTGSPIALDPGLPAG